MPDAKGYHRAAIPETLIASRVVPMQRRIFAETGQVLSLNMVIRRMIESARAEDIRQLSSRVSSVEQ